MSYYDDDRSRRAKSTRERSSRDSYDDTVYESRDSGRQTSIVPRRDDSTSSVEEVSRDFPPGDRDGAYYRETTVRKSGRRPVGRSRSFGDDRYYDDRYDDRTYVERRGRDDDYVKRGSRDYDDRRRSRRYDSYSSESSRSRTPPKRERRKSTTEEILGSLGLGGVAAAVMGKDRDRSRSKSRHGRSRSRVSRRSASSDRSRGKSKSRVSKGQVSQAVKAALVAGATEAFLARKEPGGWGGERGKRVLTAALTAGGVDGLVSNKQDPHHHQKRDIFTSAIAGLATNHLINGPRSKSRGRNGSPDGRGRSQSRGGIGDLAAGGVMVATAKKVYDHLRSQSRGRARSRHSSDDSDGESRSPPPGRRRSLSVGVAKGLAALGLTGVADKVDPNRRRRSDDDDDRSSRNGGYYGDPRDVGAHPRSLDASRAVNVPRELTDRYSLDYGPRHTGDPDTDSDSDLGSSSEDEKELKKARRKQLMTAGLATVATVHAAHSVYQSMEKREARNRAVRERKITEEKARKEKNKNRLQDAASIGIAVLGIKGAMSEWQETREHQQELKEEKEKKERHRAKREARRRKMRMLAAQSYRDSGYTGSLPNMFPEHYSPSTSGTPYSAGPVTRYYDDNPYDASHHQLQKYGPSRSDVL